MSIIKPRTLSGFMELLPGKQAQFERMMEILRKTYSSYGFAPTILNVYMPLMVDILPIQGNKFTMTYYRGAFTPLSIFAPLILVSFYGTKERLVVPKSRMENMSFMNSLRSVMNNRFSFFSCPHSKYVEWGC